MRHYVFELWALGNMTLREIEMVTGVRAGMITVWAKRYGWKDRLAALERKIKARFEQDEARLIEENRASVYERELHIGRQAHEIVTGELEKIIEKSSEKDLKVSDVLKIHKMAGSSLKIVQPKAQAGKAGLIVKGNLIQVGLKPLSRISSPRPLPSTPRAIEASCTEDITEL